MGGLGGGIWWRQEEVVSSGLGGGLDATTTKQACGLGSGERKGWRAVWRRAAAGRGGPGGGGDSGSEESNWAPRPWTGLWEEAG
jgi:hypothetical protein